MQQMRDRNRDEAAPEVAEDPEVEPELATYQDCDRDDTLRMLMFLGLSWKLLEGDVGIAKRAGVLGGYSRDPILVSGECVGVLGRAGGITMECGIVGGHLGSGGVPEGIWDISSRGF